MRICEIYLFPKAFCYHYFFFFLGWTQAKYENLSKNPSPNRQWYNAAQFEPCSPASRAFL